MNRFVLSFVFFLCLAANIHAAPFAYIADSGYSRLAVIDLATHRQRASIHIPNQEAEYLTLTADGKRAYVANYNIEGGIWVVDTLTMQLLGPRINVASPPGRTVLSPDGKYVYTLYPDGGEVSALATATNTLTSIPLVNPPCDIVFTPDSSRAYVSDTEANVSVINTLTKTVVKTISLGNSSHFVCGGMAITPDGSQIYATRYDNYTQVSIIDTATNTLVGSPLNLSGRPVRAAVAPDGAHVYFLINDPASLAVVSRPANTQTLTLTLGQYPTEMAVKPDGSEIDITDYDDNSLWIVKTTDYSTSRMTGFCSPMAIVIGPVATDDQIFANSFDGC